MDDWWAEEQQVQMSLARIDNAENGDQALDAQRILELAQKAYFLYITQDPAEQSKLLGKLFLNCSIDAASITPTYRYPFDQIFERGKS